MGGTYSKYNCGFPSEAQRSHGKRITKMEIHLFKAQEKAHPKF
jgi:hypothetical protein